MKAIDAQELGFLVELAFNAIANKQVYAGINLANKLYAAYADNRSVRALQAYSYIVLDDFAHSDAILQDLLAQEAEDYDAMALYALSLALQANESCLDYIAKIPEASPSYALAMNAKAIFEEKR